MTTIDEPASTTGQPEELFVRFANTFELDRGEPVEHLPDPEALLTWLRDEGLISNRARAADAGRLRHDPEEGERRLERFRRLRDLLHAVAVELGEEGAINVAHRDELNHILRHGLHYHQLRQRPGGTRYAVSQIGDRLDQARATIAGSLAHFLAAGTADRLRTCANQACRYMFVDRSPAGRRRWCDMRTCGNRAKVARHRARVRPASRGAGISASGLPPTVASV